jgi:hypothetical protein
MGASFQVQIQIPWAYSRSSIVYRVQSSFGSISFCHHLLVVSFFATGLCSLDFTILALELAGCIFGSHHFLKKCALPLLLGHSGTEVLGGASNQSSNLGKFGDHQLGAILFIVPFRVEYVSHAQQLQIAFKFRC